MANVDEQLGRRVAALRKRAGLTQLAVAERADTGMEVISRLERGKAIPSIGKLAMIADAIGADMRELFDFESRDRTPMDAAIDRVSAILRRRPVEEIDMIVDMLVRAYRTKGK